MKFDYKLVRSARRTLAVCISQSNEVIVRAPYRAPQEAIDAFLNEKRDWIEKKIERNTSVFSENDEIRSYSSVLVSGERRPLHLGDGNFIGDDCVHLMTPACAEGVFVEALGCDFLCKFRQFVESYGFNVRSVKIRSYKSRWGCCDEGGNIAFNFRLLMLSADIQRYVIVHELCHTVHMNHSGDFWGLVGSIVPEYKIIRSELRSYDFLTDLYW